ncbi:MAG: sulfatase-like hydrolase/transferase [Acidobacteriota bacterium]
MASFLVSSERSEARAAEPKRQPNILFIAVDDLRAEFGAYGADYIHSPNLDRLAKRGVAFNRAYCRQAVCAPSRSSAMTGTRPDTTKVWDLLTHFRIALPEVVTLGQHSRRLDSRRPRAPAQARLLRRDQLHGRATRQGPR